MERTWLDKLKDSLSVHLGNYKTERILSGHEDFPLLSEVEKSAWCARMTDRLDHEVDEESLKIEILSACSCRCYDEHLTYLKEVYKETQNIDKLLEAMHKTVFRMKPIRDKNRIIITKAPAHPEEYKKATTPEEKRYHFCHCENVRAVKSEISKTYCYCGAGWCKNIWEEVLGRPVTIEIRQSVLLGDDACQFAVYL